MNCCPCCTENLLRQVRGNQLHWFCPQCRQEMPVLHQAVLGAMTPRACDQTDTR